MKNEYEYEVNEQLLVFFHIVHNLYYNHVTDYPKHIDNAIEKLIFMMIKELDKNYLGRDIKDEKLYRRVIYYEDK